MRAFLLILGLLMVAALTALFAGPVLINWNSYRGSFEKQATALLGREVRVGGNVSLRLLPSPYLHFDNVRIADQTGRFDNPLIRVEGFTIWLSVSPLLKGAIEAREIELDGPDIRLSVDETGKANWQGLAPGDVALPFMPTEVSLPSVKINSGKLSLLKGGGPALFAVDGIDGELAAVSLFGPYRFKGRLTHAGAAREVRVSTAALGTEHGLKVKAVVRVPDTANAYSFDGDLLDLDKLPRLAGTLEAQFGLSAAAFAATTEGEKQPETEATTMRLVGRVESDLERASLADLNITFDSDGRPQLVTGEVGVEWKQRPSISAELAARWLDLDRISGKSSAAGPWPALEGYLGRFLEVFAGNAETRIVARIDQANLGGDLIGNVALDARRTATGVEIAMLTAQLPGATTLDVKGMVADSDGRSGFTGPIHLSGASLAKLLTWAVPGLKLDGKSVAGFYMVGATADLEPGTATFDGLSLEIDRSRITGSLRYQRGDRPRLALSLDGDRLDLSEVVTKAPDLPELFGGWMPEADRQDKGGAQSLIGLAAGFIQATDSDIDLRVGELKTAAGRLENLDLKMHRNDGRIDLDRLAFKTGSGLGIETTGSTSGGGDKAEGLARFRVEAPTSEAVAALDRFLALPDAVRDAAQRYAWQAPLRGAGTVRQDAASGRLRSEIALDGSSAGERMTLSLRSEDGLFALAQGQTDIAITMADKNGSRLLARLAGRPDPIVPADITSLESPVAGALMVRASGIPGTELTATAKLASGDLDASFDGKVSFAGDARRAEGRVTVTAASTAPLVEALGIAPSAELASSLDLEARVTVAGSEVAIDDIDAKIDGLPVDGSVRVATTHGSPAVEVALKARRMRLPGLLAPLLSAEEVQPALAVAEGAKPEAVPAGEDTPDQLPAETSWSDRPFRLAILDGWTARLRLDAAQLELINGLSLEDARLTASSEGGGLTIDSLEGAALGGAVKASGALKREPAGASVAIDATIDGAELEEIFVDEAGRSKARGEAKARLTLKASGLTPRGMIAVLEGEGELHIDDGQINGLSPVTVDQAARSLLSGTTKITQDAIAQAIGASRQMADYPMGSLTSRLSVVDGTLRGEQVEIGTEQSAVRLKGQIDLDSLQIESDWTIAPKAMESLKAPLPAISILYSGPLAEVRTLAAEADVEALERELLARRLIGGEVQLDGVWPDVGPREESSALPDADRIAPIPVDETVATVPPLEPAETVPGATSPTAQSGLTAGQQVESAPPKPAAVTKKRRVKRKTVTIRDGEQVGVR